MEESTQPCKSRKRPFPDEKDDHVSKILIEDKTISLLSFCNEILLEIFKHLDGNSLISIGKTNTRFDLLKSDRRFWNNIDLTSEPLKLEEIYKRIKYCHKDTTSLKIRGMFELYPQDGWSNEILTENFLHYLCEKCIQLDNLEIHSGCIDFDKVSIRIFPKTIKRLVLNNCFKIHSSTSKRFFPQIDLCLINLEELILDKCSWFETHDLIILSKIPGLKKLSLRGCKNLHDFVPYGSMATRFGFKKLEYLDVSDTLITDSDIQCFNLTLSLKVLFLECPIHLREGAKLTNDDEIGEGSGTSNQQEPISLQNTHETENDEDFEIVEIFINRYPNNVNNNDDGNVNENPEEPRIPRPHHVVHHLNPTHSIHHTNRSIKRALWFERRYPLPLQSIASQLESKITDRGIFGFGCPREQVFEGLVWIRAEERPHDTNLERLTVRHYKLVTDLSLVHLGLCAPNLVYLDLTGTSVTREGVEKFKNLKPLCYVISDSFTG